MASSIELSTTSYTRWCKPRSAGVADVHAGPLADVLQVAQVLQSVGAVFAFDLAIVSGMFGRRMRRACCGRCGVVRRCVDWVFVIVSIWIPCFVRFRMRLPATTATMSTTTRSHGSSLRHLSIGRSSDVRARCVIHFDRPDAESQVADVFVGQQLCSCSSRAGFLEGQFLDQRRIGDQHLQHAAADLCRPA